MSISLTCRVRDGRFVVIKSEYVWHGVESPMKKNLLASVMTGKRLIDGVVLNQIVKIR